MTRTKPAVSLFEANPSLQAKWEKRPGSFQSSLVNTYYGELDRNALAVPPHAGYDALQDTYMHLRSALVVAKKLAFHQQEHQPKFDNASTARNPDIERLQLNYGMMEVHFTGIDEILGESKKRMEDVVKDLETGAVTAQTHEAMDQLDTDLASASLLLTQLRDDVRAIQKHGLTTIAAKEELATCLDTLVPHIRQQMLAFQGEVMELARPLREQAASEGVKGLENVTVLPVDHRDPDRPVPAVEATTASVTSIESARVKGGRAPQ